MFALGFRNYNNNHEMSILHKDISKGISIKNEK